MRDLFMKLFSMSFFDSGITLTAFSIPHFVYLALIFGGIALIWLRRRNKDITAKTNALRLLAYALVISYLSDFFFHEFVYDGLNQDKLPFHICTVLCPLVAISQFHHKGHKFREPVAVLAALSSLMYLCYPASVGSGEPWCYQAVQTMFYHGVLLAWGILTIAFDAVQPRLRNIWKCAVLLVCITLWAALGNALFDNQNWFFLKEDAFYIGLVGNGIIPEWVLLIANPIIFLIAALAAYGVIHLLKGKKKATVA